MMCQGAVAEGDVVVSVKGGELPPIVVSKCIPCKNHEVSHQGIKERVGMGLILDWKKHVEFGLNSPWNPG